MNPPQTFDEQSLRFEFDPALWHIIKWDDSPEFTGPTGIQRLNGELTNSKTGNPTPQGTKAMDFVGLRGDALYLFEVKDFRGHAPENAYRQEKELALEIGLKARDTIAGIVAVNRLMPSDFTRRAVDLLARASHRIHVIAWIVEDRPSTRAERRKHNATTGIRTNSLKVRLSWLTRSVWADDPVDPYIVLDGVRASNIRSN